MSGRVLRMFVIPIGRSGHKRRNVLITSKQRAAREKKMAEKQDLAMQASDNVSAERIAVAGDEVRAGELSSVSQPTMEAVRILDHPSSKTTYEKIVPGFQLVS
jgi:hypothetical protein